VLISVGGGWRLPAGGEPDVEGRLGAAFELGRGRHRLALAFAGGAATATEARWQSGTSTLRRFPFSAGLLLSFDTRPGRIEPALAATLDLLAISSSTATSASRVEGLFVRPAAGIELTLGYRLPVAGGLFVRPVATGGMTLTRYEVVTVGGDIVFRTPRVYAILGLEGGLVIR
jgi:hypothetical protein